MKPKSFLIIDDDADETELFHEAMENIDRSVSCHKAINGKDAFQKLSDQEIVRPDLIFLDINMPVMNGWQFLTRIKDTLSLKDIPVIMYSTSALTTDAKNAISAGALCFVTKPNSFHQLEKVLETVIHHIKNDKLPDVCVAINKLLFPG
jgi:CheY-like chemotaxis protein